MGKKKQKKKSDDEESKEEKKPKDKKNKKKKGKKTPEVKDVTPVVKVIDKKAIVDQHFADRNSYHIYPDDENYYNGKFFSCTLNKSDLDKNNNKFYIIQLLENDSDNSLILFTRWGRVGVPGQQEAKDVDSSSGPKLFMKKYRDKTKGGYQEIFIDYEAEVKKEDMPKEKKNDGKKKKKYKNDLNEDVMDLIRLIYNKKMISDDLHEIGYDSQKMPLGKLSPVTLTNGLNILKQIESELKSKKPNKDNLKKLSSDFYTQIPHNFGFQKMSNFIIDTTEKVKEKIDMISILSDMKITLKILENVEEDQEEFENQEEKQLNDYYKQLNCDIRSIEEDEEIYSTLEKYLTAKIDKKSNDSCYYGRSNRLSLVKAYELNRHGEKQKFKDLGNKKLLWHGSRMTNFVGILSQGLRIAPPEAPSSGYLYGKGVYFADMSLKSSYYCYPVNNIALILLGEVSLGKEDQRNNCDCCLPKTLKKNTDSVHALGRLVPSKGEYIDKDLFVPNGEVKVDNTISAFSDFSEYIVYNVDQVRLRYLLKIRYN
jgi:poly [ADP-ribose] polymerase